MLRVVLVVILMGWVSAVQAILIEKDLYSNGDGLITYDSKTGLEWLDLTETINLNFNDVFEKTLSGGIYDDWQIANNADVTQLWNNAGINIITFNLLASNYEPVNYLLDFLGRTHFDPIVVDYSLSWGRTNNSYSANMHNVTLLWETDLYNRPEGLAAINTNPQQQPNDVSSPTMGTYLFRVAQIPEPPAIAIMGLGLLGLFGVSRRKEPK